MLLKLSKFFLYASVFAVLIVMISAFFPFIGGKDYYFRFTVELALICFVLWWGFVAEPGAARKMAKASFAKPMFIAVSLFVLVFLLASAFAYDPVSAFWSNYERGEGGFQMIHYYAFFVLLSLLFTTKEDWAMLMKVSVMAAVFMILYGVLANLGLVKTFISVYQEGTPPAGVWSRLTQGRFQGSLGNPAYVAPYLLFSLFYLAYLWVSRSAKTVLSGLGYGGLALVFLFLFVLSQTRGAFVGLGTAVFVFLAYLAWHSKDLRKWLLSILVVCVALVSGLIYYHDSAFVKKLPGGRIFDISISDQTVTTRLWTWGSAWEGFKERPILGWGPENFSAVFDKYFNPGHYVPGKNTETWFDRAHSLYFDALVETGALGFLSYFGIFAVLFWQLARFSANNVRSAVVQKGLIIALSLGYLVQGLAIFDVLPIYINLFLFFAFSNFYVNQYESR
ncbi:MAG: O-antigen ligase family protein [Candidatus Liptonbacteria bacterium]|nr:O-antigen ligase family protein [Candidatus Liptonbacteria bacterium]